MEVVGNRGEEDRRFDAPSSRSARIKKSCLEQNAEERLDPRDKCKKRNGGDPEKEEQEKDS